ncbi:MAG: hypothetical protein IH600_16220 [Bacteroidetes bacterium]|nr:hypothetical protein [Bacteroidota bacterium]
MLAASIGFGGTISFGKSGYLVAADANHSLKESGSAQPWPGLRFIDGNQGARIVLVEDANAPLRYYSGAHNPSQVKGQKQYRVLTYRDAWVGVDIEIRGTTSSMQHTVTIDPTRAPEAVRLRFDNVAVEQLQLRCTAKEQVYAVQESGGGVEVVLFPVAAPTAFTVSIGFNFYWGGTGAESEMGNQLQLDRRGDLHLTGTTRAPDFPFSPSSQADCLQYFLRFSPDGIQLYYSSFFHGCSFENAIGLGADSENRMFAVLRDANYAEVLTPDAQYRSRIGQATGAAMLLLDTTGALVYGSALPEGSRGTDSTFFPLDARLDRDGNAYIMALINYNPACLTPDAMSPVGIGGWDGLLMKFDAHTHRLTYATCLGTAADDHFECFAVDGCGGVAYLSSRYDSTVLREDSVTTGCYVFDVVRLTADCRHYLFQRELIGWGDHDLRPGSGLELRFHSRRMEFDADDNLYFAATTRDNRFPVVRGLPVFASSQNSKVVAAKLSRKGEILYSTYYSGNDQMWVYALTVDNCGTMMLSGWVGWLATPAPYGLPMVNPVSVSGNRYLAVFDTRSGTLEFSTLLGFMDWHWGGGLVLSDSALYTVAHSHPTLADIPLTAGMHPHSGGTHQMDPMITRLDMPQLCGKERYPQPRPDIAQLVTTLHCTDTIRIDLRRRKISPPLIHVSASISNTSLLHLADSFDLHLGLSHPLQRGAGSSPFSARLGSPAPMDSVLLDWYLETSLDAIAPAGTVRVTLTGNSGGSCPVPIDYSVDIPVKYIDDPDGEISCSIFVTPQLAVKTDRTRLQHDTLLVSLQIRNRFPAPAPLASASLNWPRDVGLTLIEPLDSVQVPPLVPAYGEVTLRWKFSVTSWPFGRPLKFSAVIVDTFGIEMSSCSWEGDIPGTPGSICILTLPDRVSYRADDSTSQPYPVIAELTIENPCDSIRPYTDIRLDLSRALHLRLLPGESPRKSDTTIAERTSCSFTWNLRVYPPPRESGVEEVTVRYRTNADTVGHECTAILRLQLLSAALSCELDGPDSLHIDVGQGTYVSDTVVVVSTIRNSGVLPQPMGAVRLECDPLNGVIFLDSAVKSLPRIDPGREAQAQWRLQFPRLPFTQMFTFTAVAEAADGGSLTTCLHRIYAQAFPLTCQVSSVDSVHYNAVTGSFDPVSLVVTARFENRSDTALTNLGAVLDTSLLQRVHLLDPSRTEQILANLPGGQIWEVSWLLEPTLGEQAIEERVRVRFHAAEIASTTLCEAVVWIDGEERLVGLHCATDGHDTLYADGYYERFIPDPLHVSYTVTNTGTVPLTGCEAAIILPAELVLATADSIQSFTAPEYGNQTGGPVTEGTLLPGASCTRWWLISPTKALTRQDPLELRWSWVSDEQGSGPGCSRTLWINPDVPPSIVLTPLHLHFEAEKGGPLPTEQNVQLWTGGGVSMPWTAQPSEWWLDARPAGGSQSTQIAMQPNSTMLDVGAHGANLQFTTTPTDRLVEVTYVIRKSTGISEPQAPGTFTLDAWPQPVSAGGRLSIRIDGSAGEDYCMTLYDLLGRKHAELLTNAGKNVTIDADASQLTPGVYLLRAVSANGAQATRMISVTGGR